MNLLKISRFFKTFPRFFPNKIFQGSQVRTLRCSESAPVINGRVQPFLREKFTNKPIELLEVMNIFTIEGFAENQFRDLSILKFKTFINRVRDPWIQCLQRQFHNFNSQFFAVAPLMHFCLC